MSYTFSVLIRSVCRLMEVNNIKSCKEPLKLLVTILLLSVLNGCDKGDLGMFTVQQQTSATLDLATADKVVYVNHDVTDGDGSGDSWENAMPELSAALQWAADNWDAEANGTLHIWVAAGVYKPTSDTGDQEASFQLISGVEIYGGFAGTETALEQRDWRSNATILSGDIDDNDNHVDDIITDPNTQIMGNNSYTVVSAGSSSTSVDITARLDGVTVTGGRSNGGGSNPGPARSGAGIYIQNNSSPELVNLIVQGNIAAQQGGGLYITNSSPTFTNVIIRANVAQNGGGMMNNASASRFYNVLIAGNTSRAAGGGGVTVNPGAVPEFINVTITGNIREITSSNQGSGMVISASFSDGNGVILKNSIIWGNGGPGTPQPDAELGRPEKANSQSSHNLIGSLTAAQAQILNIHGDFSALTAQDIFENWIHYDNAPTTDGDYRLREESPAVNSGSNAANNLPEDLDGNERIQGFLIDLGAYESDVVPERTSQEIAFVAPERLPLNTISLRLPVTSSSGLPVTLTVDDKQLADIRSDGNLYLYRLGTVTITATQEGNHEYEAAEPVVRTIRIFDDGKLQVRVHPAVSPNGDGINDFLYIENITDYPDNKVFIFDSHGRLVTEINGYDNAQNVFTGKDIQDGTYFYTIEASIRNRQEQLKGSFVVKRN